MRNLYGNLIRASSRFVSGCSNKMHTIVCSSSTSPRSTTNSSSIGIRKSASTLQRSATALKDLQSSYYNRVLTMAGSNTNSRTVRSIATSSSTVTSVQQTTVSTSYHHHHSNNHDSTATMIQVHHHHHQQQQYDDAASPPSSPRWMSHASPRSCRMVSPPPPPRHKLERKDFIMELMSPDTVRHLEIPILDARDDAETRMNPFHLEPRTTSMYF